MKTPVKPNLATGKVEYTEVLIIFFIYALKYILWELAKTVALPPK